MKSKGGNKYDLEDRTFSFTQKVIRYVDSLPKRTSSFEIGKQLVRSAGSVGANYIEANESLSKKDFIMRAIKSNSCAKLKN
jgi:four helix bundle protein